MTPEELPTPTPAKAPPSDAAPSDAEEQVPQLPTTTELPEPATDGRSAPSSAVPTFEDTPPATSTSPSQVPVFGDEPQAPPSAADPLRSPFNDEPPQPPADTEESVPTAEPQPSSSTPTNSVSPGPATSPTETPAATAPAEGMPFDVGPPQMPSEDPFQDDPIQDSPSAPQSGARLEQAYRETYGIVRSEAPATGSSLTASGATALEPIDQQEPRLLRADGNSLEAVRLPEEPSEPNPLRQVSHPGRRTVATEAVSPQAGVKPAGNWRRNPLRER